MQYESPLLVSIHSHVKNGKDSIESPGLSLMRPGESKQLVSAISASWNFDEGDKNRIIGIREVFIKQGRAAKCRKLLIPLKMQVVAAKLLNGTGPLIEKIITCPPAFVII